MLIRQIDQDPVEVEPALFRSLRPLSGLDDDSLFVVSRGAELRGLAPGQHLFHSGDDDGRTYYVLFGTLELLADDGSVSSLKAGSAAARHPVSNLRPRKYTVVARTSARILCIDDRVLAGMADGPAAGGGYQVDELVCAGDGPGVGPDMDVVRMIMEDRAALPTLSDVAWKLRRSMDDETMGPADLARIIEFDPAIAARLIKVANSALYRLYSPVETCQEAIVRIGTGVTRALVLGFAVRDLFRRSDTPYHERLAVIWEHSVEVGAISKVLAHLTTGFRPEKALLAGLLHDIGALAVLGYAEGRPQAFAGGAELDATVARLRGAVGAELLHGWGVGDDIVAAARDAEDWLRDPAPEPDYADLVVIAQMHGCLGKPEARAMPGMDDVPAARKIARGQLDPSLSKSIMGLSRERIKRTRQLLSL